MNWRFFLGQLFIASSVLGCANPNVQTRVILESQVMSKPSLDWRSDEYEKKLSPDKIDIFTLGEEQKSDFLSYYHEQRNQDVEGHIRLYNFLENFLDNFSYRGDTYTANTAAIKHAGNCLSLAILTKAYADLVGLEVRYQKVNTSPIYQRNNNLLTLSSHVRTLVYAPYTSDSIDKGAKIRSKIIIDYFPTNRSILGEVIEEKRFVAMYYQNKVAEALVADNFPKAYTMLVRSMEVSPNNPGALNSLGVFYRKIGDLPQAEKVYSFAMKHNASVNLLSNYAVLLRSQGREKEALEVEKHYEYIEDKNPYHWYDIGNQAYNEGKYTQALLFFNQSIEVAPYLHESFYGQAKSYFKLGKKRQAKIAMKKAIEFAYKPTDEILYTAKLRSLEIPQE